MAVSVYSVGQVNAYIRRMFDNDFLLHQIRVRGEVSNCKYHSSGHIYFTLKDTSGTLSCVMFAGRRRGLSFLMKEGDAVIVTGSVSVYERSGSYQLYADRIEKDGAGLLNERYEQLKRKLEEMGMFDERYKKPIPKYVRRLGVVTAPTGAAVRDIIDVARRRNPYVDIVLYPAVVQGDGAKESVVRGIAALDEMGLDCIIIGRGGGSLEDLWAFNEEIVAEAVFNAQTPIISAVGHEVDTVITDYVADLRAPTPSAAAELAVFEIRNFDDMLETGARSLSQAMARRISVERERVQRFRRELAHLSPQAKIRDRRMYLETKREKLTRLMEERIREKRLSADRTDQLNGRMEAVLTKRKHDLALLASRLDMTSPLKRLAGGYGFVTDGAGKNVTSVRQTAPGEKLTVTMRDGWVTAEVNEVTERDGAASYGE